MEDLSHWDAAEDFSAAEAAALIAGFDPHGPDAAVHKAAPALARLSEGHRVAIALVTQPEFTRAGFERQRAMAVWSHALISTRLDFYAAHQSAQWFRGSDGDFERQRFARAELHRWISVVELLSKYQFRCPEVAWRQPDILMALVESSAGPTPDHEPMVAVSASDTVEPVPSALAMTKQTKRKTWRDVAMMYVVGVYKTGQYANAKAFYKALHAKAGAGDSPFEKGTGENYGLLFVQAISKPLHWKTLENAMQEVRQAAK